VATVVVPGASPPAPMPARVPAGQRAGQEWALGVAKG
jgi:hypothetical protein